MLLVVKVLLNIQDTTRPVAAVVHHVLGGADCCLLLIITIEEFDMLFTSLHLASSNDLAGAVQ